MALVRGSSEHLALDPAERRACVLTFIRRASSTLSLSVFRCDDVDVAQSLAAARQRGVDVRVLITNRAKGSKWELRSFQRFLGRHGVTVSRYAGPATRYHAKFAVADGARALVGSMNYTTECFSSTCDYLVETTDTEVVATLGRLFDHDWHTPFEVFRSGSPRLIVGPDHSRNRWETLLRSAKTHVRIADRKLCDAEMIALLETLIRRGVTIHRAAARPAPGLRLHGKAMVIDGRLAIVGSQALSPRSLDQRRELALVLSDPRLVRALSRHLDSLAPRLLVAQSSEHGERAA